MPRLSTITTLFFSARAHSANSRYRVSRGTLRRVQRKASCLRTVHMSHLNVYLACASRAGSVGQHHVRSSKTRARQTDQRLEGGELNDSNSCEPGCRVFGFLRPANLRASHAALPPVACSRQKALSPRGGNSWHLARGSDSSPHASVKSIRHACN